MSTMITSSTVTTAKPLTYWPDLDGFACASDKAKYYAERTWMTQPQHIGDHVYRVWVHDTDGPRLHGKYDRAMAGTQGGVTGIVLFRGARLQWFLPDSEVAAFDLRLRH